MAGKGQFMSKKKNKEKEEEPKKVKAEKTEKTVKKKSVATEGKAAPAAPKPRKAPAKKKPVTVQITTEEISLRAYFIAEHRHKLGLPGSEHGDWVEAERQLREEASK